MVDILHRVGAVAAPADVYAALTTVDGLAGWWTRDTTGDPGVGGVLAFRFGSLGGCDVRVLQTEPDKLVEWEIVDGPAEWIGTHVRFELSEQDGWAIVLFRHEGWSEEVEFMHHCSTKWASFLLSLKELVETGTGRPAPDDVRISDWH